MVLDGKLCALVVPAINNENGQPIEPTYNSTGFKYWCILHDKDITDDKQPKKPHYHVVFEVQERHRMSYYFDLAKTFFSNITNENQVSCRVLLNKLKRENIRYLVHCDDPEKYQYSKDAVRTNDKSCLTNCLADCITVDYLLDVINKSDCLTDVMKIIGLDNFKSYNRQIEILWKDNK